MMGNCLPRQKSMGALGAPGSDNGRLSAGKLVIGTALAGGGGLLGVTLFARAHPGM